MARPLRIEYPGAWYHVMNRGAARCRIFTTDQNRQDFLRLLGDIRDMWGVEVHAYCLMDNHYHLLLHTPNRNLSRAMRHMDGVYTQRFNRVHNRDGQLFRGRFKSVVVERDAYLLELVRYIHFNPVEKGLARAPAQYPWSSHRDYLNHGKKPSWLVVDEVLSRFAKRRDRAATGLDRFVKAGTPDSLKEKIKGWKLPIVLGTDAFKDWIRSNFAGPLSSHKEIPEARRVCRERVSVDAVFRAVRNVFRVNDREITRSAPGLRNDARSAAIYLMRQHLGVNYREIGKTMGGMSAAAVAKAVSRTRSEMENDGEPAARIRSCCAELQIQVQGVNYTQISDFLKAPSH